MPYNYHVFVFKRNLLKIALGENYKSCACLKLCDRFCASFFSLQLAITPFCQLVCHFYYHFILLLTIPFHFIHFEHSTSSPSFRL